MSAMHQPLRMPVFPYDLKSENAKKLFSMALYAEEGEGVTQSASAGAGKQKTRRGGFFQDHSDILLVAIQAMVDHP